MSEINESLTRPQRILLRRTLASLGGLVLVLMLTLSGFSMAAPGPADEDYVRATEAMDDRRWQQAAELFQKVADRGGDRADAALYWQAKSLHKLNRKEQAIAAVRKLQQQFPDSEWLNEARALEHELDRSHRAPKSHNHQDSDLKLQALLYLMQTDPEAAEGRLKKFLSGSADSHAKKQALFLLMQTGTPGSAKIAKELALDGDSRELRKSAVELLGILGDPNSRAALEEVYRNSGAKDPEVAKKVLEALMVAGEGKRLLGLARQETDTELRSKAVEMLGVMGQHRELAGLYTSETQQRVRTKILEALMIAGDVDGLEQVSRTETDDRLKRKAIEMLGVMGATDRIMDLYSPDASDSVKKAMMEALMIAGDSETLYRMARSEPSEEARAKAVEQLSVMGGGDPLWELLQNESSEHVRRKIVEGFHISNDVEHLTRLIRDDRFRDVRGKAIEMLGLIGSSKSATLLADIYRTGANDEKRKVLDAMFLMDDVDGLIRIARAESDPQLKKKAVEALTLTGSPKAKQFMLELLDAN